MTDFNGELCDVSDYNAGYEFRVMPENFLDEDGKPKFYIARFLLLDHKRSSASQAQAYVKHVDEAYGDIDEAYDDIFNVELTLVRPDGVLPLSSTFIDGIWMPNVEQPIGEWPGVDGMPYTQGYLEMIDPVI